MERRESKRVYIVESIIYDENSKELAHIYSKKKAYKDKSKAEKLFKKWKAEIESNGIRTALA